MSQPSSSRPMAVVAPLIRVSRKRTADPHDALILHIKKAKAEPVKFTLFKTQDSLATVDAELTGLPVVDCKNPQSSPRNVEQMEDSDPLAFVGDESINVVGDNGLVAKKAEEQIMMNGKLLVPLAPLATLDDELVFDYYRVDGEGEHVEMVGQQMNAENFDDIFDVRFANNNELMNEDRESDVQIDDDDDSNAEDNWRNDYPDEESYDEDDYGNSDGEYYGELVEGNRSGYGNEDGGIHERLGRMTMSDRYESYYGGEDTSDDES